jgi:hypothetical protein
MSTVRKSLEQIRREGGGRVDRTRLGRHSEADVARMAAGDDTAEPEDTDLDKVQVVRPGRKQDTGS